MSAKWDIYEGIDIVHETRDYPQVGAVPIVRGEFWTARQRASHRLHQVSYRACFKANLPEFFIERLSAQGDVVYDCFMGRGTTVLQAVLMGRRAVGCDINPLSKILCAPRLNPPSLAAIEKRLLEMQSTLAAAQSHRDRSEEALDADLLAFYHPETLRQLQALRELLSASDDPVDHWIQMVATTRLTGHSAGFFSVYTLPPNQALSAQRQRRINEKRSQRPEKKDILPRILRKSKQLLTQSMPQPHFGAESTLLTSSAQHTPEIPSGSVQLVVTSPPFLDVVDYAGDNWLRCWFNEVDVQSVQITDLSKPEQWAASMARVLAELERVLVPGGYVAFEVGEVKGGTILLEEWVIVAARDTSLQLIEVMIHEQAFTKTANCWGIDNDHKGTNTHRIVLFQKPA